MRNGNDEASSASLDELEVLAHSAPALTQSPPVRTTDAERPCYEQGLLRLIDDLDRLQAAWEREPLVATGLGSFTDIISIAAIERMLRGGMPSWGVRMFDHGPELPAGKLAGPGNTHTPGRQPVVDLGKVSEAVARGATLTLQELQTFSPEVGDFAALVSQQTGYLVSCWAFLTPPHSRGVNQHEDRASVFLRQVEGSKRWRVSRALQRRPGRAWRPADGAVEILDVVLHEGDCLYMPRGFIHVGETEDEPSLHLTLSMDTLTWTILLQQALTAAAVESELLGEMVPPRFDVTTDRRSLFEQRRELLNRTLAGLRYSDVATALAGDSPSRKASAGTLANAVLGRPGERSG